MKFRKILSAVIISVTSVAASAGSFDGPYMQLGIGGARTETQTNFSDPVYDFLSQTVGFKTSTKSSQSSFIGKIEGGWSKSVEKYNLATSIFYVIGNQNAGSNNWGISFADGSDSASIHGSQSFTLKNTWGINLEPGYYVSDTTLGYLKFSWFNSTISSSANLGYNYNIAPHSGSGGAVANTSFVINGVGYGLGLKQVLSDKLYGYLEYQYVYYGSVYDTVVEARYKPAQNIGLIGLGYKF